jgi:uncharacterized membrane protein
MPKEPSPAQGPESDERLLAELRSLRQGFRKSQAYRNVRQLTSGQRIADTVAAVMGSWTFIICQSIILFVWIGTARNSGACP